MEMRGMMGGFYKISEWIMRLSVTNVLWLLCSLPVWFFLLLFLVTPDMTTAEAVWLLIFTAIVAPFTLFPATSAMFSVARKWVMGDTDAPLFKTFFRSYKQNYLQAMLGGILYAVLFGILGVDCYEYYSGNLKSLGVLAILFLALMVLLFVSLFQFFSLLSHFHMKTMQILKNAVVLTIGRPFRALSTAIASAVILYISFRYTFLLVFFAGSVIAAIAFFNFYHTVQKMQAKAEAAANAGADDLKLDESATKDETEEERHKSV